MAIVRPETNRVDSFAAAHNISPLQVIRWNIGYFVTNRTFWLPVGEDFNEAAPLAPAGHTLLVNDSELLVNGDLLEIN